MNAVSVALIHDLRPKIIERRARLQAAASSVSAAYVNDLLAEVDAALQRIDNGTYGLCDNCHDPIEPDRLERNPLTRFCLDHLTEKEMRAHEQDLELATQIQTGLLPQRDIATQEWETHFRYEPAGVVGGDYCEIISARAGKSLFFAVGDVAGKGVAASLLMAHLSAILRSLLSLDLPLVEIVSRANRLFSESTGSAQYATLVAGLTTDGGVDLCNAGHCRPLVLRGQGTERVDATGVPLGLFGDARYAARHIRLDPGDRLVLYSDGITEAQDADGREYEEERLVQCLRGAEGPATELLDCVCRDVTQFRGSAPQHDDITLLIVGQRQQ